MYIFLFIAMYFLGSGEELSSVSPGVVWLIYWCVDCHVIAYV